MKKLTIVQSALTFLLLLVSAKAVAMSCSGKHGTPDQSEGKQKKVTKNDTLSLPSDKPHNKTTESKSFKK